MAQTPLLIVHLKVTLLPAPTAVIVVEGEAGVVIVAEPLTRDHDPVPTAGVLAAMVKVEVLHKVWSGPAADVVGSSSFCMLTSSVASGQTPLEVVHLKVTFVPAATLVIVVVGEAGVVMVAEPLMIDQDPEPAAGVLAAIVKVEVLHNV